MANEIGLAQLAGSIPDVVRAIALKARYSASTILKEVMSVDKDVAKFGDRVSLSVMPKLSVNSVGTGGSVTRQQLSLTAVEVTIDQWKEVTVDIEDRAEIQSALSVLKEFSAAFGDALREEQDIDIAELAVDAGVTQTIGDGTDPLDDTMVRQARLTLDRLKVPKQGRKWILSVDAEADLLALARFSEAQNTGFARGLQVEGGRITKLYGDPVVVSPDIYVTTDTIMNNIYMHEEGFGVGTQRNFKIVPLAKVQLSEAVNANILYGMKVVRANHVVNVKTVKGS
jgi:hypothetical protein